MSFLDPFGGLKLLGVSGLALVLASVTTCQAGKLYNRNRTITAAEKTIGTVTKERDDCRANLSTLDAAVTRQNEATRAYQTEVERRLAEAQEAVQQARKGTTKANTKAGRALASKPSADLCQSLDRVMLESVR